MKNFVYFLLPILLYSCKENPSITKTEDSQVEQTNVVENIDAQSTDPFQKTYRTNQGMVEDIYYQLVLSDKNLAKLDTQIKNLNTNTKEVINAYQNVMKKSEDYYQDAFAKTATYQDTLMQKKVNSAMKNSSKKYEEQTAKVKSYIAAAQSNIAIINDHYSTFKIYKTLPEIEKYQNTNSFNLTNLNNLMSEQNKILSNLKKTK